MRRAMDKSTGEKMPQFYFVFRDEELIGYMFFIGDDKKFRAFPWIAIDNLDELPMRIVEQLAAIAVKAWNDEGGSLIGSDGSITEKSLIAREYERRLENYRRGIGKRDENECAADDFSMMGFVADFRAFAANVRTIAPIQRLY